MRVTIFKTLGSVLAAQCPGSVSYLRSWCAPCSSVRPRRAFRSYVLRAQGPEIRFGREKLGSFETRLRERQETRRTQGDSDIGQEI